MSKQTLTLQGAREQMGVVEDARSEIRNKIFELRSKKEAEKRNYNESEETELRGLREKLADQTAEYEELRLLVQELDAEEEARSRRAANSYAKSTRAKEEKELENFSYVGAIRAQMIPGEFNGIYREMHEEAVKEARAMGHGIEGIGIPTVIMSKEKRDQLAGTAIYGKNTVPDEFKGFVEILQDKMIVKEMGATMMTGLSGNIVIPTHSVEASAAWEGEVDEVDETTIEFGQKTMSPKRLGAFTDISKQLILQSSIGIESFVRDRLIYAVNKALETAALKGTGLNNQPTGLLTTSGIGSVSLGDNGGAPTYNDIVALEKEVEIDNALMGTLGFLTNPKVKSKLKLTKLDAGSGLFVWPQNATDLNGYKVGVSNLVPSDLTKGNGTALSAIIFGNWADLVIGQWGPIDIMANPYTKGKNALVEIIVNSWWDILVRHAQSFAAIVDANTDLT